MTEIKANSNFHTASKTSVFDARLSDPRFKEYRRRWFDNPAGFIAGTFPIHLDIESTSACNLRCPFCAATADNWGVKKAGFMDFSLFKRIIDEGIKNDLFSIKLSLRGEPLLHRQLADMVRYAKERGIIDIYFNTNASLLTEEIAVKLMDAGLDRVSVSFEGTTKEVYEKYRVGANFETVIANVRRLREIRDARKSALQIRVQTVLLPELKHSFSDYVKFWEQIADEVSYLDARRETQVRPHPELLKNNSQIEAKWACPFLWQRMMILWDGSVFPCLMHGVRDMEEMKLGNAATESISSMWNSEKSARIRALHKDGRSEELGACLICSYREMEIQKSCGKQSK